MANTAGKYYLGLLLKFEAQKKFQSSLNHDIAINFNWVQFPKVKRRFESLLSDEIVGIKPLL